MKYTQLSPQERYTITACLKTHQTQANAPSVSIGDNFPENIERDFAGFGMKTGSRFSGRFASTTTKSTVKGATA